MLLHFAVMMLLPHFLDPILLSLVSGPDFMEVPINTILGSKCMKVLYIALHERCQWSERYSVSIRIQSERGKMRTRITPNKDTFNAVLEI